MKTLIKTQSYVIALAGDQEKPLRMLVEVLAKVSPNLKVADALLVTTDDPALQPLLASLSGLDSQPETSDPADSEKKKPAQVCSDCGKEKPIAAKGLCAACYMRMRSKQKAATPPAETKPKTVALSNSKMPNYDRIQRNIDAIVAKDQANQTQNMKQGANL